MARVCAKLPWHHNIKLSFKSLSFCLDILKVKIIDFENVLIFGKKYVPQLMHPFAWGEGMGGKG